MKHRSKLNGREFPGLVWPLRLTYLGLLADRLWAALWPAVSLVALAAAIVVFGGLDLIPQPRLNLVFVISAFALVFLVLRGLWRFHLPSQADVIRAIDGTLSGQPLQTLADELALGRADAGSMAIWRAHLARLAAEASRARAVIPQPRLAAADPAGLRLLAAIAVVMALIFGPSVRQGTPMIPAATPDALLVSGPSWEGWLEPPSYTGKPTLYLSDLPEGPIEVPLGSQFTLRFYGNATDPVVSEAVSGLDEVTLSGPSHEFRLARSGQVRVLGEDGRAWQFLALEDALPAVAPAGEFEAQPSGIWRQPFQASDDYGVQSGFAELELDLPRVDRRHGLQTAPEPRAAIALDLPFPFSGDRRQIEGVLEEELAKHPWAGLPVRLRLGAQDAAQQVGYSQPEPMVLPERRFYDPLAASFAEQRRDLLWSRENAQRVAQILRAVSFQPEEEFELQTDYLRLRNLVRRLETLSRLGRLTPEVQDEVAEALWELALSQEVGQLADAKERLERAQERLEEAIRNGATNEEIAELMQELREAMRDYIEQLAEQARRDTDPSDRQQRLERDSQEVTNEQMDQLLQRLQELMEQGRMAEAQELLEQLQQMLENMEVTQGEQGQEGGEGQQALDGLADTLEEQQQLSDETFGDLQEQFGQGQDQGQAPGENGEQGQGGESGQDGPGGQQGRRGEDGQFGNENGPGQGQGDERGGQMPGQSLADRQQALRETLEDQLNNLPGQRGSDGQGMRRSLDDAGRAMNEAEGALREGDLGGALEDQARAMEALRDGMRELAESLRDQANESTQGQAAGETASDTSQDPLGRRPGNGGQVATDEQLLQGQDVYRRAEELLNELRRRSGDQDRSAQEKRYLERLLDQF